MQVTIYSLSDPITGECRYVGKANDLASRIRCHRWEMNNPKFHTHKVNWLRSLGGAEPVVAVLVMADADKWQDAERYWIAEMRRRGCRLTNFSDGGQTSPVEGKGHSEATKKKLRELALQRGCRPPSQKGAIVSDATRAKQSASSKKRNAAPPPMGGWNKGILKTHCKNGHAYSPENTRVVFRPERNRQYQSCKLCERTANQKFHLKKGA